MPLVPNSIASSRHHWEKWLSAHTFEGYVFLIEKNHDERHYRIYFEQYTAAVLFGLFLTGHARHIDGFESAADYRLQSLTYLDVNATAGD